jgi:hypothetical protein
MNLEIDVLDGRILEDGKLVWKIGEPVPVPTSLRSVLFLDLAARLVIAEGEGPGGVATVIFDEEEFPDSILTSRMVKRFVKKTGILPIMDGLAFAEARFPWGAISFRVDPRQGDMYIRIGGPNAGRRSP